MKEDYLIETFRPLEVKMLAEFLRKEYPGGEPSNENFLAWEYLNNPNGKAIISIARDKQQDFASQYALIPIQVTVGDRLVNASLSLNTLTGANHRRKGLFAETAEASFRYCADSDIYFTIGVPNKNSYPGFTKKLQFKHAGNLIFMVKPLQPMNIVKSFLKRSEEKKGSEIELTFDEQNLNENKISKFDADSDIELYLEFLNEWKTKKRISLDRSIQYLKWRYFNHPTRHYDLFKIVAAGKMQTLIALRTLHVYGMKTCMVMDYLSTHDQSGVKLIKILSGEMKQNEIDMFACCVASKVYEYNELSKSGFISVPSFALPQQLPFIIRQHKQFENDGLLHDLENWHFTFGDYDIF